MIFTAICGSIFSLLADMPRDYYPNSLEGKNGAELKTELHNLLKNHTRLPYGSRDYNRIACTWTVFKKSDVRPNGKVWDMYSNNSYSFSSGATKGMNIEHSVPKVGGEMPPITTEPTLSPDLNTTVPTIYTT